jgi:RNA polymerase sigma-70 factor (ECF subfamily)
MDMDPNDLPRIAHDPAVLEAFYRAHVEAVERFIVRRVDDPYLAADLTADVFLAAIDAAASYRPDRGVPAAWLCGVARNVVAAEQRRAALERRANARVEGRRLLGDNDVERMQQRIDAAAHARAVFAAVAQLPDRERAVLELVALDDLSVTEAARVLGLRPVTARVRLHRARTALRRQIANDGSPAISHPLEAS